MNRLERIRQHLVGGHYDSLLQSAYLIPNGRERGLIQKHAKIEYGIIDGDVRKSNRFLKDIWCAQNRFFEKKEHYVLGATPLNVKGLYIHCRSDVCIESCLYLRGFYDEITVFEEYERYASKGTVAIDVGANIGLHTMVLSCCVGDEGTVYAFEPRDSLCDDILKNLKLNNRKNNVVIKKKGLGRKKCKIPFNEHSGNFNQGVGMYDPDSKSEIEVVALDEELKSENRPVSLIKVDVEGMEFDVIRGAENILKKWKPVLLIEHNSPPWKLDEFVEAIPYSVKIFRVPNNLRECMKEITLGDRMSGLNNLLFLPR